MDRIGKLKEFLIGSPHDNFVQHALALEYVKIGDEAAARAHFEELLARDENYIGSYYHLGKLLERTGHTPEAIQCYEKGMRLSLAAGDRHAYSELQAALEDLED
jgi:Tfp pilus assembly protein PilF